MTMRSWTLVMVLFFSLSDPLSEKLRIFSIWPNLKLLYLGNPVDLKDGVGNIFARKVMQIPNLETDFESEQIWKF